MIKSSLKRNRILRFHYHSKVNIKMVLFYIWSNMTYVFFNLKNIGREFEFWIFAFRNHRRDVWRKRKINVNLKTKFNRYRRKHSKGNASIFDSALSHTRRSNASEKEKKIACPLLDVFACGQVSSPRLYRLKISG